MKKIFLYAYLNNNLGDDLFVRSIVHRYPNVKFYMWLDKENCNLKFEGERLNFVDKNSRLIQFLYAVRPSFAARYRAWKEQRCNAVVYIGGSIFIEYDNWPDVYSWWEYEAKNRKLYVVGANFGPYESEEYRRKMEEVFAKMEDVCFRDRYSYELFDNAHCVRYAPDILFGYDMPKVVGIKKQIFVSAIDCNIKSEGKNDLASYDKTYVEGMANLIKGYYEKQFQIVFASFCKNEGDLEGIRKIIQKMDCTETDDLITILSYDGKNQDEILTAMAESHYIIATRFHASILGFAANKPVLPIIYSDKTKNVLQDLVFQGTYCDLRDGKDFYKKNVDWNMQMLKCRDICREEAKKHYEKLDLIFR